MYGIFTYIYHKNQTNVGLIYQSHGWYGIGYPQVFSAIPTLTCLLSYQILCLPRSGPKLPACRRGSRDRRSSGCHGWRIQAIVDRERNVSV